MGHDPDNLYFVDLPTNINPERFIPHPDNDTVGVIPKKDLKNAIDAFFNYTYLDIRPGEAPDLFGEIQSVITKSIANFHLPTRHENGVTVYSGREAMERLKSQLQNRQLDLKKRGNRYGIPIGELLLWKFRAIAGRRNLLHRAFVRYRQRFPEGGADHIIELLGLVLKGWNTMLIEFRKICIQARYEPTAKFLQTVTDVAACENQIIAGLKMLQSSIH